MRNWSIRCLENAWIQRRTGGVSGQAISSSTKPHEMRGACSRSLETGPTSRTLKVQSPSRLRSIYLPARGRRLMKQTIGSLLQLTHSITNGWLMEGRAPNTPRTTERTGSSPTPPSGVTSNLQRNLSSLLGTRHRYFRQRSPVRLELYRKDYHSCLSYVSLWHYPHVDPRAIEQGCQPSNLQQRATGRST